MSDTWTIEEAQSNFAAIAKAAYAGQPQFIQHNGQDEVALISAQKWAESEKAVTKSDTIGGQATAPKKDFIDFLLSAPQCDWEFEPEKGALKLRDVDF